MIELQPAGAPSSRELTNAENEEFVDLAWCRMHDKVPHLSPLSSGSRHGEPAPSGLRIPLLSSRRLFLLKQPLRSRGQDRSFRLSSSIQFTDVHHRGPFYRSILQPPVSSPHHQCGSPSLHTASLPRPASLTTMRFPIVSMCSHRQVTVRIPVSPLDSWLL
jgi:hypothetical protein